MSGNYETAHGSRYPLGSRAYPNGVNFSIVSQAATAAQLRLYDSHDSPSPFQVIELDPSHHRTYIYWHVFVQDLKPGVFYTWRLDGPSNTAESGLRFNSAQDLLDPWARGITDTLWDRRSATRGNACHSMRALVLPTMDRRQPSGRAHRMYRGQEAVIYELHVSGFTQHPSSNVTPSKRGTFGGLIEKIPYLKSLGVTHVELLPVMAFDRQGVPEQVAEAGLHNFWGYNTHSFFSPHPHFCETPEKGTHLQEFRTMVDALHEAEIEIIMDVVFNHTAEGGDDGPVINFKGMINEIFYHLEAENQSLYRDYTGCGNTVNCNHPIVGSLLVNCLEFWAVEMGVDGFRFDLASAMARGENGEPMDAPPVLWSIELSAALSGRRMIAEAWDAAGLYQLGSFPGYRWSEWNGRYRDVIRRFVRGDSGILGEVATRICGSSDYYQHQDRHPFNSINFVTCHDGFTLWDLVSYQRKHNLPNAEGDRDGHADNLSWNCGEEGETDNAQILALRQQQARNFMAILLLSQGVPMILAGDEVLRSQAGNNNAWCQDNEVGWFDWDLTRSNAGMLRFTREMIQLRRRHASLQRRQFLKETSDHKHGLPEICWHGPGLQKPQWDDPDARFLAFTLAATQPEEPHLHVAMNMSAVEVPISPPVIGNQPWHLTVDTARPSPDDIYPPGSQPPLEVGYHAKPHSVVVLEM